VEARSFDVKDTTPNIELDVVVARRRAPTRSLTDASSTPPPTTHLDRPHV